MMTQDNTRLPSSAAPIEVRIYRLELAVTRLERRAAALAATLARAVRQ